MKMVTREMCYLQTRDASAEARLNIYTQAIFCLKLQFSIYFDTRKGDVLEKDFSNLIPERASWKLVFGSNYKLIN